MDDIFSRQTSKYKLNDYKLTRMVLSPSHWCSYKLRSKLKWHYVKFESTKSNYVPNNAGGVYTFIIKPGIARHPSCSYLMYVGMTERQMLRDRFSQYLSDKKRGDLSRRLHVVEMLDKWDGYLWFYYAVIHKRKDIKKVENALLAAYLPPSNHKFPASVRHALAKIFSH